MQPRPSLMLVRVAEMNQMIDHPGPPPATRYVRSVIPYITEASTLATVALAHSTVWALLAAAPPSDSAELG